MEENKNKITAGFFLGLLGVIGLIVAVNLYKEDSFERKSCLKGWVCGFLTSIAIAIIFGVCYYYMVIDSINKVISKY